MQPKDGKEGEGVECYEEGDSYIGKSGVAALADPVHVTDRVARLRKAAKADTGVGQLKSGESLSVVAEEQSCPLLQGFWKSKGCHQKDGDKSNRSRCEGGPS